MARIAKVSNVANVSRPYDDFIETLAGFRPTIQAVNSTSLGKILSIVQILTRQVNSVSFSSSS